MALVKCVDCGKSISNKANACINCGCPLSAMHKTVETNATTLVPSNSFANQPLRVCKKCSVTLPNDREDFLCSSCRERRKNFINKILIGVGVATTTAAIAAALLNGSSSNSDDDDYDYDYDYDGEDDDYSDSLNVWDAAEIYYSKGCDEDYTFGYSHDELEDAFNSY